MIASMIKLTERAIQKVTELSRSHPSNNERLRVFVSEGGCSGREYGIKFDAPNEQDIRVGSIPAEVIVDPASMELLSGSTVDFDDGLHGTGFSVTNPNAKETCGCGRSFS